MLAGIFFFKAPDAGLALSIKKSGVYVEPAFDNINLLHTIDKKLIVSNNNKYGIISDKGDQLIPIEFDNIIATKSNTFMVVKLNGKWLKKIALQPTKEITKKGAKSDFILIGGKIVKDNPCSPDAIIELSVKK